MKENTIIKSATTTVMLSYDYNHFETSICLENENGITIDEIDEARKNCNRLCDKAIKQYNDAKHVAMERAKLSNEKRRLELEVESIKERNEKEWSVVDKAKVKSLSDHEWNISWDYDDDYEY